MTTTIPYAYAPELPSNLPTVGFGDLFHQNFSRVRHESLSGQRGFAAFIPLLSTYYLLPDFNTPLSAAPTHILDLVPEHIIRAAAESRCVLVFDAGFEGDPLLKEAYEYLHRWLDGRQIERSNVLIINQNRALEAQYRERFSGGIQFGIYDAYIKKTLALFSSSREAFQAAVGFDRDELRFRQSADDVKTFLFLNGAPRANRIVAVAALERAGLLDDAEWSMLGGLANKLTANYDAARTFRSQFLIDWVLDEDIANVLSQTPKVLSIEDGKIGSINNSNELAMTINRDLFDFTFASAVTETEFTGGEVRRITEKLIKPLAMGHPTIVLGNPHSLSLARKFGFRTFGEVVDEGYDEVLDVGERLASVIKSLQQLQQRRRSGDAAFLAKLDEICTHNIALATSGAALENYEATVEEPLTGKLAGMVARLSESS